MKNAWLGRTLLVWQRKIVLASIWRASCHQLEKELPGTSWAKSDKTKHEKNPQASTTRTRNITNLQKPPARRVERNTRKPPGSKLQSIPKAFNSQVAWNSAGIFCASVSTFALSRDVEQKLCRRTVKAIWKTTTKLLKPCLKPEKLDNYVYKDLPDNCTSQHKHTFFNDQ